MIGIYREKVDEIPCLIVVDKQKEYEPLPMLTYFHGFTSAKEHNLPLAYLLAEKGFRVLLPDSAHHGERDDGKAHSEKQLLFWDIVMQNVLELDTIYRQYQSEGLLLNKQFGISGTSMGGITTAAALTQYSWIQAAAILMGTPQLTLYAEELIAEMSKHTTIPLTEETMGRIMEQLKQYDLSLKAETLAGRPLLFWHGEKDNVVPHAHSLDFYEKVAVLYEDKKDIQFISEKNQFHKVSRHAILQTVDWFQKHLSHEGR